MRRGLYPFLRGNSKYAFFRNMSGYPSLEMIESEINYLSSIIANAPVGQATTLEWGYRQDGSQTVQCFMHTKPQSFNLNLYAHQVGSLWFPPVTAHTWLPLALAIGRTLFNLARMKILLTEHLLEGK